MSASSENTPSGYHGRWLRVDVSSGHAESLPLDEAVLRRFIGGSGLGVHLLLEQRAAECDPLSAEAPLLFVFSPLVGSPVTTSARFAVVSKSPLTERINDSLAGSRFAIVGKRTGYDAIALFGSAAVPSIVLIDDGQVSVEPAADLWGLACDEAQRRLRDRLGPEFATAVIGPAGERMVRYATISHDGRHAGRGGSGAVLGAKRIKAVAVRGGKRTTWADPHGLARAARELSERSFGPATAKYRELGTAANLLVFNRLAALPTRNFQQGTFAAAAAIAPEELAVARQKTRASCAACTIGCEHLYGLGGPDGGESAQVRLEYESLFALGSLCGVGEGQAVLQAARRCDELGLDTISAGGTIAFAMECAERGLISAPWLRFGSGEAVLRALDYIALGRGIGKLLAEGSRRAALAIGRDAIRFAPQVKGLEIPGYDPRALQTMALGFAVGTRGADHNRSGAYEVDFAVGADRHDPGGEACVRAVATEDRAALMDSLIVCKFLRGVFVDFFAESSRLLNLVTGWDTTVGELRRAARRIVAAKKLFNIRAGWLPSEDTLPERFFQQRLPEDERAELSRSKLQSLVAAYHQARGWTPEGWLPEALLRELELADP